MTNSAEVNFTKMYLEKINYKIKNIDTAKNALHEFSKRMEERSAEQNVCFAKTENRTTFIYSKLKDFKKEVKLNENKEMRKANISLKESV